jgi:hypothetical protein
MHSLYQEPEGKGSSPGTMTRINAPGRFKELTISTATEDFPDPELPAMPMMLISAQGGQDFEESSAISASWGSEPEKNLDNSKSGFLSGPDIHMHKRYVGD